jgi:hypothetical protein
LIRPGLVALAFAVLLPLLAPGAMADTASGHLQQSPQLSPEDQARFASMALEEMRATLGEVGRKLEAAERDKAMGAVQCLSNRQATLEVLLLAAEGAQRGLLQALLDDELGAVGHEYRKIAIALQRARGLMAVAEACWPEHRWVLLEPVDYDSPFEGLDDETEALDITEDFGPLPPATSPYQ